MKLKIYLNAAFFGLILRKMKNKMLLFIKLNSVVFINLAFLSVKSNYPNSDLDDHCLFSVTKPFVYLYLKCFHALFIQLETTIYLKHMNIRRVLLLIFIL